MLKKIIILLVWVPFFIGAAAIASDEYNDLVALFSARSNAALENVTQITTQFVNDKKAKCVNKKMGHAFDYIVIIDTDEEKITKALEDRYNLLDSSRRKLQPLRSKLLQDGITAKFKLADAFLKKNCLDNADGIYRSIITEYVGSDFESSRQRAEIGIDDVRSKRKH